jgi:hypothetical protein
MTAIYAQVWRRKGRTCSIALPREPQIYQDIWEEVSKLATIKSPALTDCLKASYIQCTRATPSHLSNWYVYESIIGQSQVKGSSPTLKHRSSNNYQHCQSQPPRRPQHFPHPSFATDTQPRSSPKSPLDHRPCHLSTDKHHTLQVRK